MVKDLPIFLVIPAEAGIHGFDILLDSCLRGNDNIELMLQINFHCSCVTKLS